MIKTWQFASQMFQYSHITVFTVIASYIISFNIQKLVFVALYNAEVKWSYPARLRRISKSGQFEVELL